MSDKVAGTRNRKVREAEVDDYVEQVFVPRRVVKTETTFSDPLAVAADRALEFGGLNANTKRRLKRQVNKAFEGRLGAATKANEHTDISAYNLFGCVLPPYNLDYLSELVNRSPIHHAAIHAKVSNIVGLGFDFIESDITKRKIERQEDAESKKQMLAEVEDERLALIDWLDRTNSQDTFLEVLKKMWTDYEATGNGYLEIGRTNQGGIGYIGHIPSRQMRIRTERDGFVQVVAEKVVFFRNFGDVETADPFGDEVRPNEVIHFKKYSPTGTYYGVPDIISAMPNIAGNEFSNRFNLDYFENKAIPRHLITIKNARLSASATQMLVEFFEGMKGENHRTVIIPLPADTTDKKVELNVDPIETGIQDASFKNYHTINTNMILMAHRVPISKVGLAEGVSLAVARDADKTFKEQVTRPEQQVVDKKLKPVFAEKARFNVFKLQELTLTDEETQSKIDERELKTQSITPNEVRKRKGRAPLPGGDKVLDLAPKQAADARAEGNRERDAQRSAGATDSAGEARNPQGEGRSTE